MRSSAAFLALLATMLLAAPGSARELRIDQFDAQIVVSPDGWIEATETIRVRFDGAWQGLYRTIPVEYRTPQGLNFTLWLDVVRVTDDGGASLRYEVSRARQYRKLKVFLPGAVDTTKTVVIAYRVANALRFFEDHDELFWNVTGDQWDVPIQSASARIVLPPGATGVRGTPFTGAFGSRAQQARLQISGVSIDVRTDAALGFHEGLTVAVGWDKGFVREPTWGARVLLFLRSNWPLALPVLVAGLMWLLWNWRGRDPRVRPIVVRYQAPSGLTPAEAGALLDNSVDMRDITATIVDLAVRGYMAIEESSPPHYLFHLRKGVDEWTRLKPHEQKVLRGIFSDGARQSVPLKDLTNAFYTNLPTIRAAVLDALMGQRLYVHRPDRVRRYYLIAAVLSGALTFYAGLVASDTFGMAQGPFIIAALMTTVIMYTFGWYMPSRTSRGTHALEEVLGFEDFLNRVEGPRLENMVKTPEMFEAFLPFAMAFRVEMKWAAAFENIYVGPGSWYVTGSGRGFGAQAFTSNVSSMSTSVGTTFASSPRSSSGSGFGSSGGSGGGSGGGGGGGF